MKRLFFIVGLAIIVKFADAQIVNQLKSIVSPNAASLGMYGEVPVSSYTGTANISIPIYEVKSKNVTVPITLDYFSGGVRPDLHPSWVGLGWNLKAGGMISRSVRGLPDDYREGLLHSDPAGIGYKQGFYYSHATPISSLLSAVNSNDGMSGTIYQDSEPDEFSFNFLDFSGKFYINKDGEFSVQCNRPVKVEYTGITRQKSISFESNGMTVVSSVTVLSRAMEKFASNVTVKEYGIFNEFTLTDEFGNKYIFGNRYAGKDIDGYQTNAENIQGSIEAIEYSIDIFNQKEDDLSGVNTDNIQAVNGGMWVATSWMLSRIECANGEKINLNYDRGPFISQLATSFSCSNIYFASEFNTPYAQNVPATVQREGQLISPVYLTGISDGDLTVSFEKKESDELCYDEALYIPIKHDASGINKIDVENSGLSHLEFLKFPFPFDGYIFKLEGDLKNLKWQKLDEINITTHTKQLKNVKFHYLPNEVDGKKQRLVLDKLGVTLGTSGVEQFHQFSYYALNLLPKYLSENVDHFGFLKEDNYLYNEGTKTYNFSPSNYSAIREPTNIPEYAVAGSLQSITYPTGGSTELEYELNKYSKVALGNTYEVLDDEQTAGGVRIKTITTKASANATAITKSFDYCSSGVLSGAPIYTQSRNYELLSQLNVLTQTFRGTTLFPISNNSGGSHITYTNVIEHDGAYKNMGYTKYTYTNYDNGFADPTINLVFDVRNSKSQLRGLLKQEIKRDNGNNEVYNVLNEYTEFTNYTASSIDCFKYDVSTYNIISGQNTTYIPGSITIATSGSYEIEPSVLLPTRKTISYGSNKAEEVINYIYHPSYPLISDEVHTGGSGMFAIHKTYPFDLFNHSSIPTDTLIKRYWSMTQRHFLNYPVEIIKRIAKGADNQVVESRYNHYTEITTPIKIAPLGRPTYSLTNYLMAATYTLSTNKAITQNDFHQLSISNTTRDSHYSGLPEVSARYDEYSNIKQINDKEGVTAIISRGFNPDFPDVVVKNATFDEVNSVMDNSIYQSSNNDERWAILTSTWNKPVKVHVYDFTPFIGMDFETTENGSSLSYTYDTSYRLETITKNGKLIKKFNYHLK